MAAWRRGIVTVVLVAVCLTSCSAPPVPDDAWVVSPISYDNSSDHQRETLIDVTYPMPFITGDTAGGFWTHSSSSWLHIDAQGNAVDRFNDDLFITVYGLAATSPTELVVSRTGGGTGPQDRPGLYSFDATDGTWRLIESSRGAIGDMAVLADGRLVYVDYLEGIPPVHFDVPSNGQGIRVTYRILAIGSDGVRERLTPADEFTTGTVALDVTPSGDIYWSTDAATFMLDKSGDVVRLAQHDSVSRPVLAVSPSGRIATQTPTQDAAPADWVINGGSAEARDLLSDTERCESRGTNPGLAVTIGATTTTLPFTCAARSALWLDDNTLIVSIGTEPGAVLAKVTLPAEF